MKISLIFCSAVSCIVGFGNALTCPPRDVDEAQRLDPGRECKKSCVTDSDCSGAKKSCNCDGLCGLSCFNKDALCPELTGTLGDGTVKILLGRKYRGRAVYKCNVGYFLDGEPIRMCRSDRKWSGFAPTCTRGCDPPGRIGEGFQGSTDPGFVVGAVVQYQCKPGFYLESGNFNVTCRQDYTWSPATFICAKRECKKPLVVDNADIIGTDFHFGGSITYECKPGYLLLGSDLYRCFVSGNQVSWYPSQESKENFRTSCDPISCPAPSELENGVVNEDLAPGRVFKERISYSCNRGYRLIGQKTSRCNENGTWGTVPKCEVDPDCDFEKSANPICGYTVITGDWKRTFDLSTSNGLPGYYAKGKGELRSPSVPIQNETYCLKFKYKWKISGDDFVISKTTLGKSNEKLIWKSKNDDDVWTSSEAILTNHDPSNGNVYWEFEVKSTVLIDDVQLVKDPNCKPVPIATTVTSIERTIRTEYTTTSTTPSETVFIRTTATNYRQLTTLSFATDMEKSDHHSVMTTPPDPRNQTPDSGVDKSKVTRPIDGRMIIPTPQQSTTSEPTTSDATGTNISVFLPFLCFTFAVKILL